MRPLSIFLENRGSLSAEEIWAIWINRVKLHVGRDEAARCGGAAWPRQRSCGEQQIGAQKRLAAGASLPCPGSPGTVGVATAPPPPPRCPSVCPSALAVAVRPHRWPWVNAWDLARVCRKGIVSRETGWVLISSRGEEGTVACGDMISPSISSRTRMRVRGGELRSSPRWWVHKTRSVAAFPIGSVMVVVLERPHDLLFSTHLRAFCCWR